MNRISESIVIVIILACCSAASLAEVSPRFVCYFPNWAYYRAGDGKYAVDNIDPSLCTHLVYAFAILNGTTFTIQPQDPNVDISNRFYEKFIALKMRNQKLVTMIAIGGAIDSKGDKYSRLVSSSSNIAKFVTSVTGFLREYKFDGLDFDWEFPESASDKAGLANLLRSLQSAFTANGYYLSVAVPISASKVDLGYDVATMANTVDFVNLMAYDMHGSWDPTEADHHAPIYRRPWELEDNTNNVDYGVNYWLQKGMPASKINLGIPVYGRSWTLSNLASVGPTPPAEAVGPGLAGDLTTESGFLGYHEICYAVKKERWEMFADPKHLNGPYAVSPFAPKTWVGFDDPDMASIKANYTIIKQLGGAMVWDISTDDFGNLCGTGKNPVMTSISRKMGIGSAQPAGRFVCYFPNWTVYRNGAGKFTVNDIDPYLCTDYVYAFAKLDGTTFEMKPFDPAIDIQAEGYKRFVEMKTRINPSIKAWIAIGGWADSHEGDKYSQLVSKQENIDRFVQSALSLLNTYGFDGLDIDWEFPESESDKQGLKNLLYKLKSVFEPKNYKISVAVSANTTKFDLGYDMTALRETVDYVNLMAYDMHGSWESKTDHHAPLYRRPWEDETNTNNIDYSVTYLLNNGLPKEKLNLGIPLYGQSWTLKSYETTIDPRIPAKASGSGQQGLFTKEDGYLGYNEICKSVKSNGWQVSRDPEMNNGPYAYSASAPFTWVGYDDPEMAAYKASYVLNKKLGGAMVWDMSTDDFKSACSSQVNPILTAIALTLNGTAPTTSTAGSTEATSTAMPSNYTTRPTTKRTTVTRFITQAPEVVTKELRTTSKPNSARTLTFNMVALVITAALFIIHIDVTTHI